uniref:alpha-galactosidase n=1 Tax=Eubacterium cellulosolvens TaxID=29322 RepID=UPI000486CDD4|nr:alpha-galactosidase [[Eubacterium] cellulosolvens]
MITVQKKIFVLSTPHTTYAFRILDTGHPEHLYYGASLGDLSAMTPDEIEADAETLGERKEFPEGNMVSYDNEHPALTLENLRLEFSSYGKGDIRDPFVDITHADGGRTSDFLFESYEVTKEKPEFETLPGSYAEDGVVDHLTVIFRDRQYDLALELHYYVYEDCDVITRSSRLVNSSSETIRLDRLMSAQLDFMESGWVFTNFTGAWTREMNRTDTKVEAGKIVNSTVAGASSNRNNPFVMIHAENATEESGEVYGCNLIYSGNHYEALSVNGYGKSRFVSGINPDGFSFILEPGTFFEAPEAVLTYSDRGYSGMSIRMQHFVREHIVRGEWKKKARPVLLNSWEAAYFKIDESKLLRLAKAAKEAGMELFVMDDGWFGERNDDRSSLGDWTVNTKKLPGGLAGLVEKVNALGLDFGIWVEPEMVNVNSDLYRAHPDWTMEIPGKPHAEGRTQRILDFANPEVVEYMTEQMSNVFSSANIAYVKWDMNRIFSDVYSQYLPVDRQGEAAHRYILGVYRLADALTKRFPKILFEGCAAGGCRFDLGALCYFPQIWASDDTDALQRTRIQESYSFGYPMSVISAHVSACPNHQTLRETPLDTRFNVASFGVLGYELNLCDLDRKEMDEIRKQVELYKAWRDVLQSGDFYRGRTGNIHEWTCVSADRKKAVGLILQELVRPNTQFEQYRAKGLDEKLRYHFYSLEQKRDIRRFGDLINTSAPVHVRQGSVLHNLIAKFVTMPGEAEEMNVSGALLMKAGVKLSPAFSGTGYNEKVRYFSDFCSREYYLEAEEDEN